MMTWVKWYLITLFQFYYIRLLLRRKDWICIIETLVYVNIVLLIIQLYYTNWLPVFSFVLIFVFLFILWFYIWINEPYYVIDYLTDITYVGLWVIGFITMYEFKDTLEVMIPYLLNEKTWS